MLKIHAEIVYFEHCVMCNSHKWCTNHDEDKYKRYFTECKSEILVNSRSLNVVENQIPLGFNSKFIEQGQVLKPGKVHFPRIGSFEVYFRGKLVYSKLQTGKWPAANKLAAVIKSILEEKTDDPQTDKKKGVKKIRAQTTTKRKRPITDLKKKKKKPKKPKKTRPLRDDSDYSESTKYNEGEYGYKADIFSVDKDYRNLPIDSPNGTFNFEEPPKKVHTPVPASVQKPPTPMLSNIQKPEPTYNKPASPSSSSSSSSYRQDPINHKGHQSFNGNLNKSSSESDRSQYNEDFEAEGEEDTSEKSNQEASVTSGDEGEQYTSDEDEFKDEHPQREVTKSYSVQLPAGNPSKKKITYQNVNSSDSEFFILSSHPECMQVKDNYITIKRGQKEKFQLKFVGQNEPGQQIYYLYIDRDGEPWECIEIKADYQ